MTPHRQTRSIPGRGEGRDGSHQKSDDMIGPAVPTCNCPRGFLHTKKSQILRPKRKILQAEKGKICDAFTQPNFFLCNENTADVHPQSPIFFLINVDHL